MVNFWYSQPIKNSFPSSELMRGLGGYFIRRKIDKYGKKDHIYRAVLHTVSRDTALVYAEHLINWII